MASSSRQSPTLENVIDQFKSVKDVNDVDDLFNAINALLQSKITQKNEQDKTKEEGTSKITSWTSFIKSGSTFLKFVSDHIGKTDKKEATKIASDILEKLGNIHWVVGGLSIIAYLLQKINKVSENRSECLQLLKYMVDLADHIKKLRVEIPEQGEKLKNAVLIIVEECMKCAAQLNSKKFFSFLKTSVDSETLSGVEKKINQLYPDLMLTAIIALKHDQPVMLPISPPVYPSYAVGIEEREREVIKLLATTTDDHNSRAVVIYGLGGIGKTTLANAVLAKLSLKNYNHARVEIDIDSYKNDLKSLQQSILKDGFPKYNGGRSIILRDWKDGQDHLTNAFRSESERPLFLSIDNALRAEDLKQLLPTGLGSLPKGSRILVTTRLLGETDMFEQYGLPRFDYPVNTLPEEDALKILCKDSENLQHINEEDRKRILKICGGIPLVLKVAGAQLAKMGYNTDKCRQLFEDLEKGENVKQENLSSSVIDFVYDKLEKSAQEAFLDICCFFSDWSRRHVEYIVGSQQFKSLQEAALLTTVLSMSVAEIDAFTDVLDVEEEKLFVHDVIRAKGLSMSKSSRFMDLQSFTEVAEDKKQLKEIKGIWLARDESEYVVEEKHLDSMRNSLRVLALGGRMKASEQSQMKFKELRYLKLNAGIPLPPVKLEQLERLSVYQGPIYRDVNLLYKLPPKLKVLKVKGLFKGYKIEEEESSMSIAVVQNSCLEELDFSRLSDLNLRMLPEGIQHLLSLKTLILNRWDKIEKLPEYVCRLPSLSKLSMRWCRALESLPESFGQLISLTHLDLSLCTALRELPLSFGELKCLQHLSLNRCEWVKELPHKFGQLSLLKYLYLSQCYHLKELPLSFGQLTSLQRLNLIGCQSLKELPSSFGKLTALEYLDLSYCTELEKLPSTFVQLKALKNLSLRGCRALKELCLGFEEVASLEELDIRRCTGLRVDLSKIQNRVRVLKGIKG